MQACLAFLSLVWANKHPSFPCFSLFLLYVLTSPLIFTHKYFYMSSLSLALFPSHSVTLSHPPPLTLSECRLFNSRLRVVSLGCSMSPVPAQAYCLHTGVMDSGAADTAHISPPCPVPWGWTIIVRLCTAMATPHMAQKGMTHQSTVGRRFLFSSKVCFTCQFHCKRHDWQSSERGNWKFWCRSLISGDSGIWSLLRFPSAEREQFFRDWSQFLFTLV